MINNTDLAHIVDLFWPDKLVQETISFAGYWKDPFNLEKYLEVSIFLADINNERAAKNATYRENLLSLNKMVMFYSTTDNIVKPAQSGWWSFYAPGQNKVVVPLQQSEQYTQDWLGLKTLDQQGKLVFLTTDCPHPDYPTNKCKESVFTNSTLLYLQN